MAGLWVRAGTTCVVAEGSGSAHERAQTDPTRGVSKEPDFLRGVYGQWEAELERLAPDVLLDTTHDGVERCTSTLVGEVTRRLSATPPRGQST